MNIAIARKINLALSAVGAGVFLGLFAYIQLAPKDFDQRTRDFAIAKVEAKFDETFAAAANSETMDKVASVAGRFSSSMEEKVEALRSSLDSGVADFIADTLAAACRLDCERREQAKLMATAFFESTIARYGFAIDRTQALIVGEYDEVMTELRSDLKIFSGSSFVALLLALLLSLFRGAAAKHLLPISIALSVSTGLAVYWYVFGQDWVMTIIFSDYWGWAYASLLSILSVLMIDIAANRARVTSFVFNSLGNIFGHGFSFSPC